MSLEKMKEAVAGLVAESFKATLDEAVEHRLSIFESKEEDGKEELEESDDEDEEKEELEESDDEDEDEESDEDDEDELKEAMKVEAKPLKAPVEKFEVKDMRELTKLAKTGNYGWFMVTKKNGDEDEYIVEKGKLVLM